MHLKSLKNNILCDIHLGYYFIIQDMYFYFYLQLLVQLLVVFSTESDPYPAGQGFVPV